MSEGEDPVARVLNAYKAAVFAKDVDAFVALYDEDVRVFDLWGRWSLLNRLTWTLRRGEGGWKIVHEHTSAPVDLETSKVILHR